MLDVGWMLSALPEISPFQLGEANLRESKHSVDAQYTNLAQGPFIFYVPRLSSSNSPGTSLFRPYTRTRTDRPPCRTGSSRHATEEEEPPECSALSVPLGISTVP